MAAYYFGPVYCHYCQIPWCFLLQKKSDIILRPTLLLVNLDDCGEVR